MTQKQASEILNVSISVLRLFIKNKKLKLSINNKIIPEEVYLLKEDLEQRRNTEKSIWINTNT
jgi:hypothetical protein